MSWLYLSLAIVAEVLWTTFMKLSDGFTNLKLVGIMVIFYFLSLSLLSLSIKKIELGIAYAIWTGISMAIITIIGIIYFKESLSYLKLIFIGMIIIGTIGLNISGVKY